MEESNNQELCFSRAFDPYVNNLQIDIWSSCQDSIHFNCLVELQGIYQTMRPIHKTSATSTSMNVWQEYMNNGDDI